MDSKVASRYAEALFSLAKDENKIDRFQKQIEEIKEIFISNPELGKLFSHIKISKSEKSGLLEHLFSGYDKEILNFLRILLEKRRMTYFTRIAEVFDTLCNDSKGIIKGIIYTPYTLSDSEVKKIEAAVCKKLNKEVSLETKIDPELILGIRVEVEGKIIDGSMKHRIESLKNSLKEVG